MNHRTSTHITHPLLYLSAFTGKIFAAWKNFVGVRSTRTYLSTTLERKHISPTPFPACQGRAGLEHFLLQSWKVKNNAYSLEAGA